MWRRRHGGRRAARDAVARTEEGGRGEEQARGRKEATRGGRVSWRWTAAACTAATGGAASAVEQGRQGKQRGLRGRRREGKGQKDLGVKLNDFRGLAVKQNFPLI
jgi:hypothetical protein